jgi:superfamily II DNA/RNA helicase
MFSINEIHSATISALFQDDIQWVRKSLALHRLQLPLISNSDALGRLNYFAECVLASAPDWDPEVLEGLNICRYAGESLELLATQPEIDDSLQQKLRIRAALLYELAELPAIASAVLKPGDVGGLLSDLFKRTGFFGALGTNGHLKQFRATPSMGNASFLDQALSSDALQLAEVEQGDKESISEFVTTSLIELSKRIMTGASATELTAFRAIILKRLRLSTRANVNSELFNLLKAVQFPAELWSTQVKAIQGGLLETNHDSWGFAAPTGTGKTFLARLLILEHLRVKPDEPVLYIVPSRALVYQIAENLRTVLENAGKTVVSVSPQLIELDETESGFLSDCSVAVLTPEKADLLLRLGTNFMARTSLVIVDEAHHIESGTRGALLELYLWRVRRMLAQRARIIFLSAVTPNINHLTAWMGEKPASVSVDHRATRMRAGVYRIRKRQGWIDYADGTSVLVVEDDLDIRKRRGLVQLAEKMSGAGPVLIVTKGKGECEKLALEMQNWLKERGKLRNLTLEEKGSETIQRLDSRLEREMYTSVAMRNLIDSRIAYHHAGLPPRVRTSVEDAIRANLIDYVFATTTLAEGVNFPFSTVIVQSLAIRQPPEKGKPTKYTPVTPRSFWNIAGRAGRPGFDREGQAILFEPSLGLDKVNRVLSEYLDSKLSGTQPVTSALANGIEEISEGITDGTLSLDDINTPILNPSLSRRIHGTINLIRVGLIHAKASNLILSSEDIVEGTFAALTFNATQRAFANKLVSSQGNVIEQFLENNRALPLNVIAELGLSIETLTSLQQYVVQLEDWQIEKMRQSMFGGTVNLREVPYVVGPVAARMAELEGPKLGGFYSELIVNWLAGTPLNAINPGSTQGKIESRLEDLISIIYSRIQYLLPWGLYAVDRLLKEEAIKRSIPYANEVGSLAYLADAGVPSFDALRLVGLDFERVDATRLSESYRKFTNRDTDIISWLVRQSESRIMAWVKGADNRRIDYDLKTLLLKIR